MLLYGSRRGGGLGDMGFSLTSLNPVSIVKRLANDVAQTVVHPSNVTTLVKDVVRTSLDSSVLLPFEVAGSAKSLFHSTPAAAKVIAPGNAPIQLKLPSSINAGSGVVAVSAYPPAPPASQGYGSDSSVGGGGGGAGPYTDPAATPPPVGFLAKFNALSLPIKLLIFGGVGTAGYLGFKHFSKGGAAGGAPKSI